MSSLFQFFKFTYLHVVVVLKFPGVKILHKMGFLEFKKIG